MWTYLGVAIGGAVGCCARLGLTQLISLVYQRNFPLATFVINILGCFLMGFLFFETLERVSMNPVLRTAMLTGVLGGFTTFSTFSMETLLLAEDGEFVKAGFYILLSVMVGLLAAFCGAYIARNL
ncbi:MAG: fluoride efflux transporter CrcB [Gammaproteobacteria bacterium]|nr:fluoride efflux transporter CrcB [Gammaproteobacteria bacterium]